MKNFDLLLAGGHLIDPKNAIDAPRDLAIAGGKVASSSTGASCPLITGCATPKVSSCRPQPGNRTDQ